eukprot:jgi/Tetstr1/422065/TSEL_012925.t1
MALRKALASGFARGAGLTGRQPAAMLPACAGAAQTSHKLEDLCP